MGIVASSSGSSGEESEFSDSQIMKPVLESDYNTVDAMKQLTDPGVFRFLNFPAEIRNKIYGNLLIYHNPIEFKISAELKKNGGKYAGYKTGFGLSSQICRTCKAVACESFAVLYGKNTFHFTDSSDMFLNDFYGTHRIYSHFVKNVSINTFNDKFMRQLNKYANSAPKEKLRIQSMDWVECYVFLMGFRNLRRVCLNLPRELDVLTENNRIGLLDFKRGIPKRCVITFTGATPDIISQLTIAWPSHVPKVPELPKKDPQPFDPLEWYKKQTMQREKDEQKRINAQRAPGRSTTGFATRERQPQSECSTNEPRKRKRRRLNEQAPRQFSSSFTGSSEQVGMDERKTQIQARLLALEEEKGSLESELHALDAANTTQQAKSETEREVKATV